MTPYEIEVLTKLIEVCNTYPHAPCADKIVKDAEVLLRNDTIAQDVTDGCGCPVGTQGLLYFLVIGANGCWGRGFSVEEALKNAMKPKRWIAWKANTKRTPIMSCSDMGGLCYRGEEPVEIERKMPKEKKVKATVTVTETKDKVTDDPCVDCGNINCDC
jgi:hypothetical protein